MKAAERIDSTQLGVCSIRATRLRCGPMKTSSLRGPSAFPRPAILLLGAVLACAGPGLGQTELPTQSPLLRAPGARGERILDPSPALSPAASPLFPA